MKRNAGCQFRRTLDELQTHCLAPQTFQKTASKTTIALYMNSPQQDVSPVKEVAPPELAQPAKEHDFGIGF